MRLRYQDDAIADLVALRRYIAKDSPQSAAKVASRIRGAVRKLRRFPDMGHPGRWVGTRELLIPKTPFVVPYRMRGGTIEILRVLHGSMRWLER